MTANTCNEFIIARQGHDLRRAGRITSRLTGRLHASTQGMTVSFHLPHLNFNARKKNTDLTVGAYEEHCLLAPDYQVTSQKAGELTKTRHLSLQNSDTVAYGRLQMKSDGTR
jgi:cellobiose-specific phosphotransferase system component IIB